MAVRARQLSGAQWGGKVTARRLRSDGFMADSWGPTIVPDWCAASNQRKVEVLRARNPIHSAHTASSTNHTRLHIVMVSPRKLQSMVLQSPLAESTFCTTPSQVLFSIM